MKIRNGFVSNSSSSSFVVMLPETFDELLTDENIQKGIEAYAYDDIDVETAKPIIEKALEKLKKDGYLYQYDSYDDNGAYYMVCGLLSDYTITSVESGPDDGTISTINKEEILKVFEKCNIKL